MFSYFYTLIYGLKCDLTINLVRFTCPLFTQCVSFYFKLYFKHPMLQII